MGYEQGLNLYQYALNDPITFHDPNGTEVQAFYFRDSGLVTARDLDTGEIRYADAFSGGAYLGVYGASIPSGTYDILEQARKPDQFRLERLDSSYGDDRTPEGRSQIRLHVGTISIGCITLCTYEHGGHGDHLMNLIRGTSTSESTVRSQSRNPFAPRTESLTNYGTLQARDTGDLRFNRETGEISRVSRITETGSRLPRTVTEHVCTLQDDGTCQ